MNDFNYKFKKLIVITGHYGCGKTNTAINIALKLAKAGEPVTIIDLDVVNPYFRTSDREDLFNENNIKLVAPLFANSNVDIPAISSEVDRILDNLNGYVIIDVGGDDAGATVLGRYAKQISKYDFDLFYVFSAYRFMTDNPQKCVEMLRDIEINSKLKATALINNSNIGVNTTKEDIEKSVEFAESLEFKTSLEVKFTCVNKEIKNIYTNNIFYIENYIKPVWEQ